MISKRRALPILLFLLLLLAGGSLLLRRSEVRDYLASVTGEEDLWEGIKGLGALIQLSLTGPDPDLAPEAVQDHHDPIPYGANTFLQLEPDPENVRRSLAMMRDGGIRWARQHFPWEDIEIHGRGDFEDRRNGPGISAWAKYDRIVDMATDHQVQLLVRLDDPPAWAYADPEAAGAQKGPPDDLEDYGRFVAEVVGRYCGRLRYYQIWNEPNIYPEWGEADVDPAGYAELLAVAARHARQACDDVVIVSAALAPTTEPGGRNMHDLRYLEALYDAGWQDDFDVLAAQAFGLWTGPNDHRVSENRTNFVRPLLVRDIMVARGDAHKPVWITEFGWDSPPEAMDAPYGRVSEAKRAEYTVRAYERIATEWPWIGPAFLWFFRRPSYEWHTRPEGYFRIVEPNWTQLPTYRALSELANRPAVLRRGRHDPVHHALTYTGPWRDHPRDGPVEQRIGTESAELQLAFVGTGFEIDFLPPPAPEGALPAATTESSPTARSTASAPEDVEVELSQTESPAPELFVVVDGGYEQLQPEQRGDRLAFGRRDLDPGEHVVILRVDAGEAWIDEIRIFAPDPPSPLAPLVSALMRYLVIPLILLAVLWLYLLRRRRRRRASGPAPDSDPPPESAPAEPVAEPEPIGDA